MSEQPQNLVLEYLRRLDAKSDRQTERLEALTGEVRALRGHVLAIQEDIHNIYGILGEHSARLERIERRLDLAPEPAE